MISILPSLTHVLAPVAGIHLAALTQKQFHSLQQRNAENAFRIVVLVPSAYDCSRHQPRPHLRVAAPHGPHKRGGAMMCRSRFGAEGLQAYLEPCKPVFGCVCKHGAYAFVLACIGVQHAHL